MKFLARNLLLTIVFYFNFRESNCSGLQGTGSVEPSSSALYPHGNIPPIILDYHQRKIEVSYHIQNGHRTPKNCTVLGEHFGVPTIRHKERLNYITRALLYDGIKYCVVYEKENGEVLGAKLPPPDDQRYTGDPLDLNPNELECYMTYNGQDIKVTRVPHEVVPLKLELLPNNMSNPKPSYVKTYDVRPVYVHFGGLYFIMHRRHKVKGKEHIAYIGADLDLEGPNRPPELYSGSSSG